MEGKRVLIIYFMLLIVTASFAPSISAAEDFKIKKIAANEDYTSSECVSNQSIPCNWEGWKNSFPGVRCKRRLCNRYIQVLSMKCMAGFLAEVRVDRICAACQESPGL